MLWKRRSSDYRWKQFASDMLGMLLNFINSQHKQLFGPIFGYFQPFGRSQIVEKLAGIRLEPDEVLGASLLIGTGHQKFRLRPTCLCHCQHRPTTGIQNGGFFTGSRNNCWTESYSDTIPQATNTFSKTTDLSVTMPTSADMARRRLMLGTQNGGDTNRKWK